MGGTFNIRTGEEIVRGEVIGDIERYYSFHTTEGKRLGAAWFADDKDAKEWAKERWPIEYKNGIEMRCYE